MVFTAFSGTIGSALLPPVAIPVIPSSSTSLPNRTVNSSRFGHSWQTVRNVSLVSFVLNTFRCGIHWHKVRRFLQVNRQSTLNVVNLSITSGERSHLLKRRFGGLLNFRLSSTIFRNLYHISGISKHDMSIVKTSKFGMLLRKLRFLETFPHNLSSFRTVIWGMGKLNVSARRPLAASGTKVNLGSSNGGCNSFKTSSDSVTRRKISQKPMQEKYKVPGSSDMESETSGSRRLGTSHRLLQCIKSRWVTKG